MATRVVGIAAPWHQAMVPRWPMSATPYSGPDRLAYCCSSAFGACIQQINNEAPAPFRSSRHRSARAQDIPEKILEPPTRAELVTYRQVGSVITATRMSDGGDFVRIFGPGSEKYCDLGDIQSFDEFFVGPNSGAVPVSEPEILLESLIYYLEGPPGSMGDLPSWSNLPDEDSAELQPRHGVHLQVASTMRFAVPSGHRQGQPVGKLPLITHVRESGSVPRIVLPDAATINAPKPLSGDSEGGSTSGAVGPRTGGAGLEPALAPGGLLEAVTSTSGRVEGSRTRMSRGGLHGGGGGGVVQVVAGECRSIRAPPPLDSFLLLDVFVRPGSSVDIPLPPSQEAIIYILEGVGFFGGDPSGTTVPAAYHNEGHGLVLPPLAVESGPCLLQVRSHPWSQLRFLVVSAP